MATDQIPEHIKHLYTQPSGTVIAVQVRQSDPPQVVADDLEDMLDRSSRFWSGEQCDGCGCSAYVIEREPAFPDEIVLGWRIRCCGDADEAKRWEAEGADPEAVEATRTGCGTTYRLSYMNENEVQF